MQNRQKVKTGITHPFPVEESPLRQAISGLAVILFFILGILISVHSHLCGGVVSLEAGILHAGSTPILREYEEHMIERTSQRRGIPSLKRWVLRALPEGKMIIIWGPLFFLYAGLSAACAGFLRTRKNVRTPYTRKIFHFFIFTMAGIIHLGIGLQAVVLYAMIVSVCVLYAVWRGDRFPFYEALARETDAPHRTFFILVPLLTTALGGVLSNLFFAKYATIGYLVCGWGDAVGEPVGARWGKHCYRVPSLLGVKATRSLEGSSAVWLCGSLVAGIGLAGSGLSFPQAFPAAMACGTAGMIVEAISSHGLDNLTIQVTASAVAAIILR